MSTIISELLIGTNNNGKIREFRSLLCGLPAKLLDVSQIPSSVDVEETGETFAENARIKAIAYAASSGVVALSDDSGLVVDALDGRPGIRSARYGGKGTSFADKMSLLLNELAASPSPGRGASFVCSMAVADPEGHILAESEGICSGVIASEPRGAGGFGYDPVFIPDGFEFTFGELPETIKSKISHRARAIEQIMPFLRHLTAV